jgi:hypothetical protein
MRAAKRLPTYRAVNELYNLTQEQRNIQVKKMCKDAGWYWEDVESSDGVVYTAFSPEKV